MTPDRLPIAVTMGEPAGIGGELSLLAWLQHRQDALGQAKPESVPPFFVIDDPERLAALAAGLGLGVPVRAIASPAQTFAVWPDALPVFAQKLVRQVTPGAPAVENTPSVTNSISQAVAFALGGEARAIVTNPIHKKTLYDGGFSHTGHTDFLATLARKHAPDAPQSDPVMMLATPELRVVPATIHLPLAQAITALSSELIFHCGRVVNDALVDIFEVSEPRIAVTGLNPHAGEDGALGAEEDEIIRPALEMLSDQGIRIEGPVAADTIFNADNRARLDAVICMYHDQALIPVKTLDFWRTVNITLGLPFVRTSPGHGTGFSVAGTGKANPASFVAALTQARAIAPRTRSGMTNMRNDSS